MEGGVTGKGFVKGDPRINRKGRPKSFDKLRELAQQLANEAATLEGGKPLVIEGHIVTQIEALLRKMIHDDPQRFVEIAFGKVPNPVELTGAAGEAIKTEVIFKYADVSDEESSDTAAPAQEPDSGHAPDQAV